MPASNILTQMKASLGGRFISQSDVLNATGLVVVPGTPPPVTRSAMLKDHLVLFPGPSESWSLMDLEREYSEYFQTLTRGRENLWFRSSEQLFSREDTVDSGWLLLANEPLTDSISDKWPTNGTPCSDGYYVPNVAQVVWLMILWRKLYPEENLFENILVRTCSQITQVTKEGPSPGPYVYIGTMRSCIHIRFHGINLGRSEKVGFIVGKNLPQE